MTAPQLEPRKTPIQGRSKATCDAVLEAAARILEEEGRAALTTNRIAERAGVSVGSLYQYFPGKEAIVAELIRGMRRDMVELLRAAVEDASSQAFRPAVATLLAATLRHHTDRPALARALEREEEDLPIDAETQALKSELRVLIVRFLDRWGIADAERCAFDLVAMCHGMAAAAIRAGEEDVDDLAARLQRAVLGYLGRSV
jgi:AcrR family transcriptional regulator